MSSGESSTATAAPSQPSLAFTPEELKQWFEDHGQLEAGATSLDFGFGGSDFGDLVASGEGKAALEELGVAAVLQRHKIVNRKRMSAAYPVWDGASHYTHDHDVFADAWLDKLVHEVFDALDSDHDGRISKDEILTTMIKGGDVGPGVSGKSMTVLNKEVDEVFAILSDKETGLIEYENLRSSAYRMLSEVRYGCPGAVAGKQLIRLSIVTARRGKDAEFLLQHAQHQEVLRLLRLRLQHVRGRDGLERPPPFQRLPRHPQGPPPRFQPRCREPRGPFFCQRRARPRPRSPRDRDRVR